MIVLLLAVTGLMLNHVDDLAWMEGTVGFEPLLDWYGVAPREEIVHFDVGRHSAASLEQWLFLDGRAVGRARSSLVGAVAVQRFVAFALRDRIVIFDPDPKLADDRESIVDQMDTASLPGDLLQIGSTDDRRLAVETPDGRFASDEDLLGWEPLVAGEAVAWSQPSTPNDDQREGILHSFRGTGLPRTRVVQDLHSGRIFGSYGPVVMDAAAVVLLVLVATGIAGSGLGRRRSGD